MQLMQSRRVSFGLCRGVRDQPAHRRSIVAYSPSNLLHRPGNIRFVAAQGFQGPYGGGGGYPSGVRTAVAQQLAQAKSLQDVQDIINRYSDYLSPAEILQLASAAPRMVRGPNGGGFFSPGSQPMQAPFPGLTAPAAAAAERQRRAAAQQQQQQQQYQDMMNQLASGFRRAMPDAAGSELADTAYALAHAGALDEGLAAELLQHTARQAAAGKLGVQGLADVLMALGSARYRPTPAIVQKLVRDVDPVNKCNSPQELSALLEGLSCLGFSPDESFADTVLARMKERQSAQQRQAKQQQQPQQKRGFPSFGWGKPAPSSSQPAVASSGEETDDEEAERERQEAQHVSAAIRSLQRMGHMRQAEQLRTTYLQDLQKREAARMQARQQRAAQRAAEEQALLEKQRLEQQRLEQQRFERLRAEQQHAEQQARIERERVAAQERAAQLRAEQEQSARAAREREASERERAQRQRAEKDRSTVQAAVVDAVTRARTWQQLHSLLYSLPPEYLSAPQLCVIVSALPQRLAAPNAAALSWRERAQLSNMLETWGRLMSECLQEQQQQLAPAQLIACLQALVSVRWLNEEVWGLLLREARRVLPVCEPQQLFSLLQVLSEAGLRPSGPWMDEFLSQSARKLTGLGSPAELRELGACLLKLGVRPPSDWLIAYLGALQAQESQMSMEEAAACMRVAAQWDAGIVQRWYQGLMIRKQAEQRAQQQRPAGVLNRFNTRPIAATVVDTLAPEQRSSTSNMRTPDVHDSQQATAEDTTADTSSVPAEADSMEGRPLDPPDSLYNRLMPDVSSIDFDEETGAAANKQQLPDNFLLHHMGVQAPQAKPQPLTPKQARALRSVLQERVELAEERAADVQRATEAARMRQENAAVQLAAVRSQLAVLQGDYDRVQARHRDEKAAVTQQVGTEVMSRLLPMLDNFERASMSLKASTAGEKAVIDAYQQLPVAMLELLSSFGIKEVPGVGQPFDPAMHDAIMQEYAPNVPEGTVLAVLQKGYQSGERLLRPALVKVSSA